MQTSLSTGIGEFSINTGDPAETDGRCLKVDA
jgi:hypothetical protein